MKALRITRANRDEVAAAVGGRAWADGVIVALPGGGEKHLRVGEYALVPTTPREKETPMDSSVTVRLTASQAAVINDADGRPAFWGSLEGAVEACAQCDDCGSRLDEPCHVDCSSRWGVDA